MAATYYIFFFFLMLVLCCDGNVLPLRAIKNGGIRIGRPLTRNDRPNAIYLKSDPTPPIPTQRRTHYPAVSAPPRQKPNRQLQGFFRNGHHPPRGGPAPVAINNHHHHAMTGGKPGKFQPTIQQQHLNHQHKPNNNNQHGTNQPPQENDQQKSSARRPYPEVLTTTPPLPTNPPLLENLLKFQPVDDDYLTYLYLEPNNDNRLDQVYLTAAAINLGDGGMNQKPQDDEEDVIIGSPSMNFDPYSSKGLVFNSDLKKEDEPFRPLMQARAEIKDHDDHFKSIDYDWVPIASPWEKYKVNSTARPETKCDATKEKC